uniref:Uncharacterized protein n=1 Tax=Eucampia antarctica TaxID=49252 RepID=A0A7S2RP34_9STRA|mmetsp:Transcript_24890/g.23901  ORF Transcript_24890/g.23901 Transcript_24890/m.23901 type:complete len:191 (+) Transcript_24890:89-661(+)|eukprot:CAMPEP_0197837598 /NCGR_PEP_ID=MMETSP1437-20131217/32638_1 /TAXON_ID=49252 ORGANISM="Eucampia antarctica, Strain CCMP1452" /NCGR_SAMPLE_ID=MMETSP1437 /ASSEMBLY_ACC=CAM_ASM_001096 /LENGTH=190 /DNA_ID=CAMNT_0043444759 /DNA_START=75 /DNA_END=647 /DNA_ORIENTATION=-
MKTAKVESNEKVKELEFRGTPEGIKMRDNEMEGIQYLILKGREEIQKQKLFKCKNDNLQFEMKYAANRVNEIWEEIVELKEDGYESGPELNELKNELKATRLKRKTLYEKWVEVKGEEEKRRTAINIEPSIIDTHTTSRDDTTVTSLTGDASPTKAFITLAVESDPPINCDTSNSKNGDSDTENTNDTLE